MSVSFVIQTIREKTAHMLPLPTWKQNRCHPSRD